MATNDQRLKLRQPTISEPPGGRIDLGLRELWEYRELLYYFTWRNVKVRYKQTILGASWAVLQPFTTMVVFSIFFGGLAQIDSNGFPYPVFSFAALVPWTLFQNGVQASGVSMVSNASMITKVYFPRMIIPISAVVSSLVDFFIALGVLFLVAIAYGIWPTANLLVLPLLTVLAVLTSLGLGFWFSALNVQFRDIGFLIPFFLRIWMFVTPVIYPTSLVSEEWRTLYALNPMVGVIEGFRWAILGTEAAPGFELLISLVVALVLVITGAIYFRKTEFSFADVV